MADIGTCAVSGVVLMMAMAGAVQKRGYRVNWPFIRLYILKYIGQYRRKRARAATVSDAKLLRLLADNRWGPALANVAAHLLLGLIAVWAGITLVRAWMGGG